MLIGFTLSCSVADESQSSRLEGQQQVLITEPTVTPEPTPTPEPECLSQIPVRYLLGQLIMTLAYPEDFAVIEQLSSNHELGIMGILGTPSREDLENLIQGVTVEPLPLLLASDEEGGRVQRLRSELGRLPSASELSTLPLADIEQMFYEYGRGLLSLGIGIALAPVVDVGQGPGIGDRSFSNDPQSVIRNAGAVISGFERADILPVLKHFPGHGNASHDSHEGLSTTSSIETLREVDLLPYQALLKDSRAVMMGHLVVPGLTENLPASLSSAAVEGLLREELGFDGLVLTDSLGMGAISNRWSVSEAAVLALNAGVDIVMVSDPHQVTPLLDELEKNLQGGELDERKVFNSIERVLNLKDLDPCQIFVGIETETN